MTLDPLTMMSMMRSQGQPQGTGFMPDQTAASGMPTAIKKGLATPRPRRRAKKNPMERGAKAISVRKA